MEEGASVLGVSVYGGELMQPQSGQVRTASLNKECEATLQVLEREIASLLSDVVRC